jgi:hypothetical protein
VIAEAWLLNPIAGWILLVSHHLWNLTCEVPGLRSHSQNCSNCYYTADYASDDPTLALANPKPNLTGRKTRILAALILVLAALGIWVAYAYLNPVPCCAPPPASGSLFLQSYNFQTSGSTGSLFVVLGVSSGQNFTLEQVYFDQLLLTKANSGLNATCGRQSVTQGTPNSCTVTISFGPSLPAPSTGSTHNLEVVTSNGVTTSFSVRAGTLYESTLTSGYQTVSVSGTVFQGCVGSAPVSVTFQDESGNSFTTNVLTTGNSWTYSISLIGGHTYTVSVSYRPVVPNATTQTAGAGSLVLGAEPTATYDIPC